MAYNYWCHNRKKDQDCDFCNSKGDIKSDEKFKGATCYNNEKIKLKLMGQDTNIGVGEKMKHRPKAEAKKRSSDHFKKEILPTLSRREKAYFKKKKGYTC